MTGLSPLPAGSTGLGASEHRVHLVLGKAPYCASRRFMTLPPRPAPDESSPWTVGLVVTVSVGSRDDVLVVTYRPETMVNGGA